MSDTNVAMKNEVTEINLLADVLEKWIGAIEAQAVFLKGGQYPRDKQNAWESASVALRDSVRLALDRLKEVDDVAD